MTTLQQRRRQLIEILVILLFGCMFGFVLGLIAAGVMR